jgi:hypothetical protein
VDGHVQSGVPGVVLLSHRPIPYTGRMNTRQLKVPILSYGDSLNRRTVWATFDVPWEVGEHTVESECGRAVVEFTTRPDKGWNQWKWNTIKMAEWWQNSDEFRELMSFRDSFGPDSP